MKLKKQLGMMIVMLLMTITCFAQQNERQEKRKKKAEAFAELAAKEFNLNEEQKTALFERKLQHLKEQDVVRKKSKKETVTDEEKKAPNKAFAKYFRKLTGKTYKEIKPFQEKVVKEMKKV